MNARRTALVCGVLVSAGYAALWLDGPTLDTLIAEDGPVESLGATGLFGASILFAASALRERTRWRGRCCLLLAALLFVGGGEEISWGQRVFGWGTPEGLAAHNLQDETNLHNLSWMSGWLDAGRLFNLFTFGYLVLLPAAAAVSSRLRGRVSPYVPLMPVWFALPFVINQVASKLAQHSIGLAYAGLAPLVHAVTELKETHLALLYLVVAVLHRLALGAPSTVPAVGAGAGA